MPCRLFDLRPQRTRSFLRYRLLAYHGQYAPLSLTFTGLIADSGPKLDLVV